MNTECKNRWSGARFTVRDSGCDERVIVLGGRARWALERLIAAGISVETVTEGHEGPFKGTHARYVLRSHVARHPDEVAT